MVKTWMRCSFEIKTLDMAAHEAYEESLRSARAVCEGRNEFAKWLVHVAKENGGHKTLAKQFHDMFPDRFAYLGKVDG